MTERFDEAYWESHWRQAGAHRAGPEMAPNPYLERETSGLVPGTALDAGCGEGAEARWLATAGWRVTGADMSHEVLTRAAEHAAGSPAADGVRWVEADLTAWEPGEQFDLVTTHYAHPAMSQVAFYRRISDWVAPGGTLLIVGHLHPSHATHPGQGQDHGHHPPEASATVAGITAVLDAARWDVVTADEQTRALSDRDGRSVALHDVVVRATRRP